MLVPPVSATGAGAGDQLPAEAMAGTMPYTSVPGDAYAGVPSDSFIMYDPAVVAYGPQGSVCPFLFLFLRGVGRTLGRARAFCVSVGALDVTASFVLVYSITIACPFLLNFNRCPLLVK